MARDQLPDRTHLFYLKKEHIDRKEKNCKTCAKMNMPLEKSDCMNCNILFSGSSDLWEPKE